MKAAAARTAGPFAARHLTGWLAILVFALNVLAPVLVNAPARAGLTADMGLGVQQDGRVVICTPSGLRVIGADGALRPLAEDAAAGEGQDGTDVQFCVFCLPLVNGGGGALAAAEIALPLPAFGRLAAAWPVPVRAAAPTARHRLPEARAPPSSVA